MKKNNIKIKQVIAGLCILLAGIFYTVGRAQSVSQAVFETVEAVDSESGGMYGESEAAGGVPEETGAEGEEENTQKTIAEETEVPREIFVHVCGEVKNPGVYRMEEGSRIYEALEQAGGFTDRAASDFLNMAQMLEDGMKLIVPDEETVRQIELNQMQGMEGLSPAAAGVVTPNGSAPADSPQPDKVNINTASKEQLMTLKGIGEARAEDIISYREQSGSFRTIEDIMKVSGIKEAAFQKIKENITV